MPRSISLWSALSPHVSVLTSNRPRCISWQCRDSPCLARTWPGSIQVRLATNPISIGFFIHGKKSRIGQANSPLLCILQLLVPASRDFLRGWERPSLTSTLPHLTLTHSELHLVKKDAIRCSFALVLRTLWNCKQNEILPATRPGPKWWGWWPSRTFCLGLTWPWFPSSWWCVLWGRLPAELPFSWLR